MNTLFALVLSVAMQNGEFRDVVTGVYDSLQDCQAAAVEQQIAGECLPIDGIIHPDEVPAEEVAQF